MAYPATNNAGYGGYYISIKNLLQPRIQKQLQYMLFVYAPPTNSMDGDELHKANREQNEHKSKKHPQEVLCSYVNH